MKKAYVLYFGLAIIVISLFFLHFFGIQKVYTDKSSYSVGEPVKIHLYSFKLYGCSCSRLNHEIYKFDNGWRKLELNTGYGNSCVDGKLGPVGMPCDVIFCNFFQKYDWDTNWYQTYYENLGPTNYCDYSYGPEGAIIEPFQIKYPIPSFTLRNAVAGKYKVKYGLSEAVFTIN